MARGMRDRIRSANQAILGDGDLIAVEAYFATDYVLHTAGKNHKGHRFVKSYVRGLRTAIPNLRVIEVEFLAESGNRVVWQRTLRGTHRAELKRIPPTGKKVEWRDMMVTRFNGKKIAEEWAVSDLAGQLFSKFPRK